MDLVVVFAFFAAFVLAAWLARRAERLRVPALAAVAKRLGFELDPAEEQWGDDPAEFAIFREGSPRVGKNTMTGTLAPDCAASIADMACTRASTPARSRCCLATRRA